jgi:hypothetical protein
VNSLKPGHTLGDRFLSVHFLRLHQTIFGKPRAAFASHQWPIDCVPEIYPG